MPPWEVKKRGTYKEERHKKSTITTRPKVRPLPGPRGGCLIFFACGHTKKEAQEDGSVLLSMGCDEKLIYGRPRKATAAHKLGQKKGRRREIKMCQLRAPYWGPSVGMHSQSKAGPKIAARLCPSKFAQRLKMAGYQLFSVILRLSGLRTLRRSTFQLCHFWASAHCTRHKQTWDRHQCINLPQLSHIYCPWPDPCTRSGALVVHEQSWFELAASS